MANPGYDGMWLPTDQDPRMQMGPTRGERECLIGYLEHYRQTLALKCDGLDRRAAGDQGGAAVEHLAARPGAAHGARRAELVPPGDRGTDGHRRGCSRTRPTTRTSPSPTPTTTLVARATLLWQSEIAYAREVLERTDLDAVVDVHGEPSEVRDIVVHMIEEYARHCGHADLLRECIDGRAGQ